MQMTVEEFLEFSGKFVNIGIKEGRKQAEKELEDDLRELEFELKQACARIREAEDKIDRFSNGVRDTNVTQEPLGASKTGPDDHGAVGDVSTPQKVTEPQDEPF